MAITRTVLVTGGSRGWGKAIVLRFASPGTRIIINYLQSTAAAEQTAREAAALGAETVLVAADLGTEQGVASLFDQVRVATDRVDVFVHNAFYLARSSPLNADIAEIERAMAVGPLGLVRCAQAVVPLMTGENSHIVCTTSTATHRLLNVKHGPLYFPMAIAKGALEVAIRYLAVELGSKNITVNGVAAGWIATEAMERQPPEITRRAMAKTPLGRYPAPREVADVVHFLGSAEGGWVTGQVVVADGGLTLI